MVMVRDFKRDTRRSASPRPGRHRSSAVGGSRRRVALVGSSGGSTLRSRAGLEAQSLCRQLSEIGATLTALCFVECEAPLDHADESTPAVLYDLDDDHQPRCRVRGTLAQVNKAAKTLDDEVSRLILEGSVDALVLVSAHVRAPRSPPDRGGVNFASLHSAIACKLPCLGTGGTSLGQAVEAGAICLSLSGSVATTAESRSIASAAALARHWRLRFSPRLPPPEYEVLPILDAVLPLALSLSLLNSLIHATAHRTAAAVASQGVSMHHIASASRHAVPVALATLASRRVAQIGDSGLLAGVLAGSMTSAALACADLANGPQSVSPAALVAGLVAGLCSRRILGHVFAVGLPATASTLVTVGSGGLVGGFVGWLLAPLSMAVSSAVRWLLQVAPTSLSQPWRAALGGLIGALTKWGSLHGYYHSVYFPFIFLEMDSGGFATLGAFDAVCLATVCAGVCAAIGLASTTAPAEAASCKRAVAINLLLGDYVEACYPYMGRSLAVTAAAFGGATLSGAVLLGVDPVPPASTAYLPAPLAVAVAGQSATTMALAMVVAFVVPCAGTLLASKM